MISVPKKDKWPNRIFGGFFIILFVSFLALYISEGTGYYEYEIHKKVTLTEEKIKQFEQDVKDGKQIDVKDYLEEPNYQYNNSLSDAALHISEGIGDFVKSGIERLFSGIAKMIEGPES